MNGFHLDRGIDIGLDLGTVNTLIYQRGKGLIVNEPSILACEARSNKILEVGRDALIMHEKLHPGIITIRPVKKGVIADYECTVKMIKVLLDKVKTKFYWSIRRMVISIPMGITEVEKRAVYDAAEHIGAREIYLVAEPMAAAIGIGLNPFEPVGNMIVNIGAGTTEIAVICLGGIASGESLPIAGTELDDTINRYIRDHRNLAISDYIIETIKKTLSSALRLEQELSMNVSGLNIETGLPDTIEIDSETLRKVIATPLNQIIVSIRKNIEALSPKPDIAVDILKRGIYLTGGGALIKDMNKKIATETTIPVNMVDNPLTPVIMGIGTIIEDLPFYRTLLSTNKNKNPFFSGKNQDTDSGTSQQNSENNQSRNNDNDL
ncbi:MAG: rod shape-determining protein [Chlorobi bacterium]|nr:rod shape-determining protein [Chlorobiota bacterium]